MSSQQNFRILRFILDKHVFGVILEGAHTLTTKIMITPDDLPNRKEERRSKRKDEDLYKSNPVRGESSDLPPGHKNIRQKIKEEIQEEEWEDWDRYYNT